MSLCIAAGGSSTLRMCKAAAPFRAAAWLPLRRMLSLSSSWTGGGIKALATPAHTQRRCAASSAAAEPAMALGGSDTGAPATDWQQQQQQQREQQHNGAIEIVVGPMFAGKTTELLRRVARYEAAGLSVAVVKSNKDDRYCAAHVVTHNGLKRVCGLGRFRSVGKYAAVKSPPTPSTLC